MTDIAALSRDSILNAVILAIRQSARQVGFQVFTVEFHRLSQIGQAALRHKIADAVGIIIENDIRCILTRKHRSHRGLCAGTCNCHIFHIDMQVFRNLLLNPTCPCVINRRAIIRIHVAAIIHSNGQRARVLGRKRTFRCGGTQHKNHHEGQNERQGFLHVCFFLSFFI